MDGLVNQAQVGSRREVVMAKRRSTKSQKNKKPNSDSNLRGKTATSVNAGLGRVVLLFVVGAMLGALLTYAATRPDGTRSTSSHVARAASLDQSSHSEHASKPLTLGDLLTLTPEKLKKIDPVEANLLCAQGLPGAEAIDMPKALATIDRWAQKVRFETERHLYRVNDPRYAEHYKHSEAVFRMEMLAQVLQEDCGVHYNKERVRNVDFTNSKDLFVHGMIGSDNGGTCVSMPVLYTAVARRLGYPVKLVEAKGHLFCRWDGQGERWSIEGAGEGFSVRDDDYYKRWPHPINEAEIKRGEYLRSLTPAEELGVFLAARGHCLEDNGRWHEARIAYARAHQLMPRSRAYYRFLKDAVMRGIAQPNSELKSLARNKDNHQNPKHTSRIPTATKPN